MRKEALNGTRITHVRHQLSGNTGTKVVSLGKSDRLKREKGAGMTFVHRGMCRDGVQHRTEHN
jgi:hypothetical protein